MSGCNLIKMKILTAMLFLFLVVGCGNSENVISVDQDSALLSFDGRSAKERAETRWSYLVAGNLDAAYTYISPGVREILPVDVYRSRISGSSTRWKKATVESAECQQGLCKVTIKLVYIYRGSIRSIFGQEFSTDLQEDWIFVDGQWWFVPEKV